MVLPAHRVLKARREHEVPRELTQPFPVLLAQKDQPVHKEYPVHRVLRVILEPLVQRAQSV
jgi:hypothetical protein